MVNEVCKDCLYAHIYTGVDRKKRCACQNSERYHLTNSKVIRNGMKDCQYKEKRGA